MHIEDELISRTEYMENGIKHVNKKYKNMNITFVGEFDPKKVAQFIIEEYVKHKSLYKDI